MVFVKHEITRQFRGRDFADGFTIPMDLVLGPDLALYVSDAGAGVIYRIVAPPE